MDELAKRQRQYTEACEIFKTASLEFAEIEGKYKNIEDLQKTMLAHYWGKQGTQKEREIEALCGEGYGEYLSNLSAVRTQYLRAKALKEVAKVRVDHCQSQLAVEREKFKII